jgi:hypothetical protein
MREQGGGLVADEQPVIHKRTIVIESVEEGDGLRVTCTLRDDRPFMADQPSGTAHDLALSLHVRESDRVITEAGAAMHTYPHAECPEILPAFERLVGLSVARGYTREVKARLAGVKGCNHLEHLATALAPAMVQAMSSLGHRHRMVEEANGEAPADPAAYDPSWLFNTCHVWRDGGPGQEKIDLGWPHDVERTYPTLSAVEIRRRTGQ